jgi:hypothetical protein
MAINPSLLIVPYRYKAAKLYSQLPESGAGDFVVTRGTTATRVNASGVIESVASGVPRLDYTGGGCPSLLVEPAATNQIRNNTMVGAVTGTPGTLPTNWSLNAPGFSSEIVSIGLENGVDYIDIRLFGTAGASEAGIRTEGATQILAASGQTWAHSTYFKIIAAPQPPTIYQLGLIGRTSGGAGTTTFEQAFTPTSSLVRYTQTAVLTGATTERIQTQIRFVVSNGASYDFTIRIGLPQMELGAVATSVIKTSTTAITRNADVISLSSASGLIGQSAGTVYAELKATNFSDGARIFTISNGTVNNSISLQKQSSNRLRAVVTTASGTVADISTASGQVAGTYKIALAYAANDFVLYVNGAQIGTDTSGAVPATSKVNFGSGATDDNQANDGISAAAIYTSRLSNSELQSLTTL